jgi:hypothetical protein
MESGMDLTQFKISLLRGYKVHINQWVRTARLGPLFGGSEQVLYMKENDDGCIYVSQRKKSAKFHSYRFPDIGTVKVGAHKSGKVVE